jgi:flagellar biosynthetic protein FlhB
MAGADQEDRTEAPSAHRMAKAREEGNVAQSRELQMVAGLGFGVIVLAFAVPSGCADFIQAMRTFLDHAGDRELDLAGTLESVRSLAFSGAMLIGPVALAVMVGGAGVALIQTGLLLRVQALVPDLTRLDPMRGLGRIAGTDALVELVRSLLKLLAFGLIFYGFMRHTIADIGRDGVLDPGILIARIFSQCLHVAIMMSVAQAVIACLDVLWVRWRRLSQLRMSRQELRDEHRQNEGDPTVKGRLRQLRQRAARKRMMAAVPKATVVITNPTHYAVALAYEKGNGGAPRVIAKGVDEVAARIREAALEHRVPIVANPPLARALYVLPLDSEISHEHFRVVAGIIAYVWKLRAPADRAPPVR